MLDVVKYREFNREYFDEGIWGQMRRVALAPNRSIAGIHDPDNTDKWDDGTNVNWSTYESNGWNCMVEIPKFYYRVQNGAYGGYQNVYRAEVSPVELPGFKLHPAFEREDGLVEDFQYFSAFEGWVDGSSRLRSLPNKTPTASQNIAWFRQRAANNGSFYTQQDYYLTAAIQMLFITEYGSFNAQKVLGWGRATGSVSYIQTGTTRQYGNKSYGDLVNNSGAMSYRGIENFYGNYWKFMDGMNIQDRNVYIAKKDFVSDKFSGNYELVTSMPTSNGYIIDFKRLEGKFDFTLLPSNTSITDYSDKYFGDYYWQTTGNRIALFGGVSSNGPQVGAFCLYLSHASSTSNASLCGRLQCIKAA